MSAPFAQITQGPATATGKNPNKQALILDRQNNILSSVGDGGVASVCQSVRQLLNAQTALTAITAAQTFYTITLNPGEMNTLNRTYVLSGYALYTSPGTTTPTITFVLSLGGVTLATIVTGPVSATASANMPIQFEFVITVVSTGSAATVETHGEVDINLTANTPAGILSYYPDTNNAVSAAINLQNAAALTLTIAASSTITSAQMRQVWLEVAA